MDIIQEKENNLIIYKLAGKMLGGPDVNNLQEKILQEIDLGQLNFIIVLDQIKWINSSGLSVLVNICHNIKQKNGKFVIVFKSENIAKMFKITRLDQILVLKSDLEEAKKYFN